MKNGKRVPPSKEQSIAVLILACVLPFLVTFTLGQNIDLQGVILILMGVMAWYGVWLDRKAKSSVPRNLIICAVIYLVCCVLNVLANPTFNTFFGSNLFRLGVPGLLACVGCGLVLRNIPTRQLLYWLYGASVLLAATTVPYALWTAGNLHRPGGVFHQPDILGVWMVCGLILGCGLWQLRPRLRRWIIPAQLLLALIAVLSQTRAILVFLPAIGLLMIIQAQTTWRKRALLSASLVGSIALAGILLVYLVPQNRITDVSYSSESIQYRLSLQSYGVKAALHRPILGYGAGNMDVALACPTLHDAALQKTCHEGHYFDSSHNIFLDRFIALGWIGGTAFLLFVVLSLVKGLRQNSAERYFVYCALLISLYYFTNVTSISIELLLWICLWRVWVKNEA